MVGVLPDDPGMRLRGTTRTDDPGRGVTRAQLVAVAAAAWLAGRRSGRRLALPEAGASVAALLGAAAADLARRLEARADDDGW